METRDGLNNAYMVTKTNSCEYFDTKYLTTILHGVQVSIQCFVLKLQSIRSYSL